MMKPQTPRRRAPRNGPVTELFSAPDERARPPFDDASVAYIALVGGFKRGEEREQRAVLARLLRSNQPLDRDFRKVLAQLFEGRANGRRLVFEATRGRQTDPARTLDVAGFVAMLRIHEPEWNEKKRIKETMDFFKLKSRSQIYALLKKHKSRPV
jgi:hypothetical protein